jgi:hypothetical protein
MMQCVYHRSCPLPSQQSETRETLGDVSRVAPLRIGRTSCRRRRSPHWCLSTSRHAVCCANAWAARTLGTLAARWTKPGRTTSSHPRSGGRQVELTPEDLERSVHSAIPERPRSRLPTAWINAAAPAGIATNKLPGTRVFHSARERRSRPSTKVLMRDGREASLSRATPLNAQVRVIAFAWRARDWTADSHPVSCITQLGFDQTWLASGFALTRRPGRSSLFGGGLGSDEIAVALSRTLAACRRRLSYIASRTRKMTAAAPLRSARTARARRPVPRGRSGMNCW